MEDVHLIPLSELGLHEESRECKCNPSVVPKIEGEGFMVIHNNLVKDVGIKVKN